MQSAEKPHNTPVMHAQFAKCLVDDLCKSNIFIHYFMHFCLLIEVQLRPKCATHLVVLYVFVLKFFVRKSYLLDGTGVLLGTNQSAWEMKFRELTYQPAQLQCFQ